MAHHGPRLVLYHLIIAQIHLAVVCSLLLPSPERAFPINQTVSSARPVPCQPEQASALIRLKRSFITTNYSAIAFRSWKAGTDCCLWVGIHCGEAIGRVTSLDLGDCGLESGRLDPAVFELTSLTYLDLAWNDFKGSVLPSSGFERLTKLAVLNLSNTNVIGQVPHGIGRLSNLVSLDLSISVELTEIFSVGFIVDAEVGVLGQLAVPNLTALVANLGNLRELHLGSVVLSQSAGWCDALAKYTPNLRILSMPFCLLRMPICESLSALHSLSVIDLQNNWLTGPFPNFFANLPSLSVLQLSYNHLEGWVSPAIFKHKKLVTIDLHYNEKISGSLPSFTADSCLQNLLVGVTNFSGTIPSSLSKVKSLKKLGLDAPGFSGNLPSSIGEFQSLNTLKVSGLDLVGPIPSWITNVTSLEVLHFSHCGLYGSIPSSIADLTNLRSLAFYNCKVSGEIDPYFSNLTNLQELVLGSNIFTGTVELNSLRRLPDLTNLNLSNNKLTVTDGEHNSSMVSFPSIVYLQLASCGINVFPGILRHLEEVHGLDISNNHINGAIPQWAWEKWTDFDLFFLNFSHNKFTSVGYNSFLPFHIEEFDLSYNLFKGPIPLPQYSGTVLDYSSNMFSSVPFNISAQLEETAIFKAPRNNLSGSILTSFCSMKVEFLDLSYNILSGWIPSCLMDDANPLMVLNLKNNQLLGELPKNISDSCTLEVLDISDNRIEGHLPRSLAACESLEVLDIGNNKISDSFPCWLSTLPELQVLVLNHNEFFGSVTPDSEDKITCVFPSVRILDLASNNFSGTLTEEWFSKLMAMVVKVNNETLVMEYRGQQKQVYQVTTSLTYKGSQITIEKILRTLAFIDVSNNSFHGSIPEAIGELVLLDVLNMSHNSLTGRIPLQLGRLNQLESLDLSSNDLSGEIPEGLAYLDFLTTLNLSDNNLVGSIPESPHFWTFSNSSFLGNDGLCGPPLTKQCINTTISNVGWHHSKKSVDIVLFLFAGLGFGVGFAIAIVVAWGIPIRKRL